MEGNEMSVAFENRIFDRRSGLAGGRMGCTLVTGFLGSGKTTLLKHLLDHRGDLRLAVLVNEFADSDIDSLLLDADRVNRAFDLPTVSLTHGCACCDVSGTFRESLQRVVHSKHHFDCLLIETSGLAEPDKFVAVLEEVGIHLDLTITVVDAESLDRIVKMDVVRKQLQHVDLVLLNKCDVATLGQISDAEDILEELTGGAKIVRSQFCRVPLDLVIDCSKFQALNAKTEDNNVSNILSHESIPKSTFQGNMLVDMTSLQPSSSHIGKHAPASRNKISSTDLPSDGVSISSVCFETEAPLSLLLFQRRVLKSMRRASGLLRAKGIIWFSEDRESRFVFQWSGNKRVEAISGQPWEGPPKSRVVLIGNAPDELQEIISHISASADPQTSFLSDPTSYKEWGQEFVTKVAADGRFKVLYRGKGPSLIKEKLVVFGLRGSPLHGIKESHLNGALMRVVNGKENIFLTAVTSSEECNLQLLLDEGSTVKETWDEIRSATSIVISKLCKNFCPCRSDLSNHVH